MTGLTGYILLFVAVGAFFVLFHLLLGKLIRPNKPEPEKLTIYECGEPTIGSSWVQFDLRYYVVALLFVIFDVEVAFFFPWAVVFGKANTLANPETPVEQRAALTQELDPTAPNALTFPTDAAVRANAEASRTVGWIAFLDLLVFFGVLLVGFAYLWKRGDIDWVRTTAAHRVEEQTAAQPPPKPELVEAR